MNDDDCCGTCSDPRTCVDYWPSRGKYLDGTPVAGKDDVRRWSVKFTCKVCRETFLGLDGLREHSHDAHGVNVGPRGGISLEDGTPMAAAAMVEPRPTDLEDQT